MITAIPAQYFKRKRGFAIGLVMSGSTLGQRFIARPSATIDITVQVEVLHRL